MAAAATRRLPSSQFICMDAFALRQFDPEKNVSNQIPCDANVFMSKVLEYCDEVKPSLIDGYAPFCKHIFMPNFVANLKAGYAEITVENRHLLRTEYMARTEQELPVLRRFFSAEDVPPVDATFLDIILYSREQIRIESDAMKNEFDMTSEWGIISVKPQTVEFETPMDPITMMRNALGVEEGGSGVALDRVKYQESVSFWKKYASII